jgi:4-amino-4-deoxy-L-arabinose transferase-like glycosyltransferase
MLFVGLFGLVIYTIALAPDMLYSDSGEFQTLAYTWGTTHTTGYPLYLILARLVGFLPIDSPAWRINFVSALSGAVALGGVYLLTRYFARRGAAVLSSALLLVSYTLWSQSIIAEVYSMAAAFIVVALLAVLRWREKPVEHRAWLFGAGFLIGVGLGVHLFLALIAPAVVLFVLWGMVWGMPEERAVWRRNPGLLAGGLVSGGVAFVLLFILIDVRPTPTSMFATTYFPSRDTWDMDATDLDSPLERFWMSVTGRQWQDRMLPQDADYGEILEGYWNDTLPREFSIPALLLAIVGLGAALIWERRGVVLLGGVLVTAFVAGLVYSPGDKYIFFLPAYLMIPVFAGIGVDQIGAGIERILPSRIPRWGVAFVLIPVLLVVCISPFFPSRWKALETERSGFVAEDYAYPRNLREPRSIAECVLAQIPEPDALMVIGWRELYSIYYVAHVEQGRTGIIIQESLPYGTDEVTPAHQALIAEAISEGRTVYVDNPYGTLRGDYTFERVGTTCSNYRLAKLNPRS